jgi:hypothetical protein
MIYYNQCQAVLMRGDPLPGITKEKGIGLVSRRYKTRTLMKRKLKAAQRILVDLGYQCIETTRGKIKIEAGARKEYHT